MSFVCLSPVLHAGKRYGEGDTLPADAPTERLLRLGVIEERKPPKPRQKSKTDHEGGEQE